MGFDFPTSISVIMPVYNRAETVVRALDSVFCQTLAPLEIIIVNDCSTDRTAEVLDRLHNPLVKVIHLERNQGAQQARIRGIKEAKGDFLSFLDSDDEWFPDSLQKRLESFLAAGFKYGLVYGDARFNGREGEIFAYKRLSGHHYPYLLKELSLCPYSVMMISRACLESTGLPSPDFPSWQDDDMVLTVGKMFPVHHCGAVVAIMHRSPNCISVNKDAVYQGCRKIVAKYADDIIRHNGLIWYYLWKLRIVNSLIISKLSARQRTADKSNLTSSLLRSGLKIAHKVIRSFLRLFFQRVNS